MKEFSHPKSKEKMKYDLNKIIETTIIVTSNEWKYSSELHTDLDRSLPLISCLADELGQVILNILVNAAHANEEKTSGISDRAKGTITVSTRQDDNQVVVRIADTGNGIPEEVQGRIFDPFFTTKPVGKGSGQGLAIAHNVVTKLHGGTISVTSEVGKGTAFLIRLPIE
jgi:signal transduction histidine kinase